MLSTPSTFTKNLLSYTKKGRLDLRDIHVSEDSEEPISISMRQMMELAVALKERPDITSLVMATAVNLTSEIAKVLTTAYLTELMIEGGELTDQIASVFFSSDTFQILRLAFNELTGASLAYIENHVNLELLDLSYNPLEEKYCKHIAKNHSLKALDLCGTGIGNEGLKELAKNDSIREITMHNCGVTEVCSLTPPLLKINLSSNRIDNVEGLLECEPLPEVILSSNLISKEDSKRLTKHYPNSIGNRYRCNATSLKRKREEEEDQSEENRPKKKNLSH